MTQSATATTTIGRLIRVPLREVWRHEAYDFTTWLQENLDVLNEATGLNLSGAEREQSVGSFSVDLLAEDEGDRSSSRINWRRPTTNIWGRCSSSSDAGLPSNSLPGEFHDEDGFPPATASLNRPGSAGDLNV